MLSTQHLIVALAESSSVQAQIIRQALSELGISRMEVFETGEALLDYIGKYKPDVVMSAFHLPDMTAGQMIFQMRGHPELRDLPFILVSSETNPELIDPMRQAGLMGILPKPFDLSQLRKVINDTMDFLAVNQNDTDSDIDYADLNILVVDDSVMARRHIRTVLERLGFEKITESWSGKDAVPLIDKTLFDLVLTDYNMPLMDGCELASYIRTSSMQSSVPIIMISSEENMEKLAAAEAAGVSAIMGKPFETSAVRQILRTQLAQR
ncbi:chemotaxis regulator [Aquitalea magnusonii]|jgi:two-component system chemotaxis response regulator CheY|uniref:Chemotaxis regulator n=1 Tax=Aquitalea magnusonii TaxID=332411 RepID=A0A3G9GCP4_9NEIS|nr:response regulator [Aquitalea magnusonii]BBF85640.1 chemotaxis regulator [Aquitalea magnusonii]